MDVLEHPLLGPQKVPRELGTPPKETLVPKLGRNPLSHGPAIGTALVSYHLLPGAVHVGIVQDP